MANGSYLVVIWWLIILLQILPCLMKIALRGGRISKTKMMLTRPDTSGPVGKQKSKRKRKEKHEKCCKGLTAIMPTHFKPKKVNNPYGNNHQ